MCGSEWYSPRTRPGVRLGRVVPRRDRRRGDAPYSFRHAAVARSCCAPTRSGALPIRRGRRLKVARRSSLARDSAGRRLSRNLSNYWVVVKQQSCVSVSLVSWRLAKAIPGKTPLARSFSKNQRFASREERLSSKHVPCKELLPLAQWAYRRRRSHFPASFDVAAHASAGQPSRTLPSVRGVILRALPVSSCACAPKVGSTEKLAM